MRSFASGGGMWWAEVRGASSATAKPRSLQRDPQLLGRLVDVEPDERRDEPIAETDLDRDARIERLAVARGAQAHEADEHIAVFDELLELALERVPALVEHAQVLGHPLAAVEAALLVERAEDRVELDLGVDDGEHAVEVVGREGLVVAADEGLALAVHGASRLRERAPHPRPRLA